MARSPAVTRLSAPQRAIYAMAAALALIAVILQAVMFDPVEYTDFARSEWLHVLVIFLLTAVVEHVTIKIGIRRQTMTFNLIDVPLVLSLFWLPPLVFVLLRIPITLFALLARGRMPLIKVCVTVGVALFETTLAPYIFREIGIVSIDDPLSWIAVYAALLPANLIGAAAVTTAITLAQGSMTPSELRGIALGVVAADCVNPTLGLLALITVQVSPWAGVLLAVLGIVLIAGYRVYTASLSHFEAMEALYAFTAHVEEARQRGTFLDDLLIKARELLHAERATLWIPQQGDFPEISLVAREGEDGVLDDQRGSDDISRQRVVATENALTASTLRGGVQKPDDALAQSMEELGLKDIIAVPLRSGSAIIGSFEFANRLGEFSTFTRDEVQRAEMIVSHASVAIENERLTDRLRFEANNDTLTGVSNRRRFGTALSAAISATLGTQRRLAVLHCKLLSIQRVNTELGYEAGDRLLVAVGRLLHETVPRSALVGRIENDTFAVLLPHSVVDDTAQITEDLNEALAQPLRIYSNDITVEFELSTAYAPTDAADVEALMRPR